MTKREDRSETTWLEQLPEMLSRKFTPRLTNDILKYWEANEKIIKKYCKPDSGIYFWGEIKTGKTVLASQILVERIKMSYLEKEKIGSVFSGYLNTTQFLAQIKDTYHRNSDTSEREIMEHYENMDFLLIDDIGGENASDWQISIMFRLINHRYEYLKYTLFTSNLPPEKLADIYGDDRISRRIIDMCDRIVEKTQL